MSDQKTSDLEYSRQLQEKFELYLLGLIFTLLALAIQTAKFGVSQVADILELFGWLTLLLSGFAGLSRFEWLAVAYKTGGQLSSVRKEYRDLSDAAAHGTTVVQTDDQAEPVAIHVLIDNRAGVIQRGEERLKNLERSILRKYSFHKWAFAIGLVFLASARGTIPATSIFRQLCHQDAVQDIKSSTLSVPELRR